MIYVEGSLKFPDSYRVSQLDAVLRHTQDLAQLLSILVGRPGKINFGKGIYVKSQHMPMLCRKCLKSNHYERGFNFTFDGKMSVGILTVY